MLNNLFSKYIRLLRKICSFSSCNSIAEEPARASEGWHESASVARLPIRVAARVQRVVDGDTCIVRRGGCAVRVRLDSIDCPEDGQTWGEATRLGLVKLIGGRDVLLEEHGLDCHGRLLATIHVWHDQKNEWLNVNERMVTLGHAWVMRLYYGHLPRDRQVRLNRLERWAKSKSIGLWRSPNPTPPWSWRRTSRGAEESSTSVG